MFHHRHFLFCFLSLLFVYIFPFHHKNIVILPLFNTKLLKSHFYLIYSPFTSLFFIFLAVMLSSFLHQQISHLIFLAILFTSFHLFISFFNVPINTFICHSHPHSMHIIPFTPRLHSLHPLSHSHSRSPSPSFILTSPSTLTPSPSSTSSTSTHTLHIPHSSSRGRAASSASRATSWTPKRSTGSPWTTSTSSAGRQRNGGRQDLTARRVVSWRCCALSSLLSSPSSTTSPHHAVTTCRDHEAVSAEPCCGGVRVCEGGDGTPPHGRGHHHTRQLPQRQRGPARTPEAVGESAGRGGHRAGSSFSRSIAFSSSSRPPFIHSLC